MADSIKCPICGSDTKIMKTMKLGGVYYYRRCIQPSCEGQVKMSLKEQMALHKRLEQRKANATTGKDHRGTPPNPLKNKRYKGPVPTFPSKNPDKRRTEIRLIPTTIGIAVVAAGIIAGGMIFGNSGGEQPIGSQTWRIHSSVSCLPATIYLAPSGSGASGTTTSTCDLYQGSGTCCCNATFQTQVSTSGNIMNVRIDEIDTCAGRILEDFYAEGTLNMNAAYPYATTASGSIHGVVTVSGDVVDTWDEAITFTKVN
jgi:hypothetical protein